MAGGRTERVDAAANRDRILRAAHELLAERGPSALTMDAVARLAGVGKGTVFRRFGDRDGLTRALLDEPMRLFQDAFLHGPPPLGPGAPPAERLEAFVAALLELQAEMLPVLIAAESRPGQEASPVQQALAMHVTALVAQLDPKADARLVAGLLIAAISPPVVHHLCTRVGADTAGLQAAARALLRGLVRPG